MNTYHLNNTNIHIISGAKNWLESAALSQLEGVAQLPGVVRAVGLPDLHAGKSPVGMALETENIIYPHLIGGDIGCGMGLFDTGLGIGRYNEKRWLSRLNHIRALVDLAPENPYSEPSPISDLGTIGGGNHFVEFQRLETVFSSDDLAELNLPKNNIVVLVHSGSRGYGQAIFKSLNYTIGLKDDSPEAVAYLQKHDDALLWARRNRAIVAAELIGWLGYEGEPRPLIDLFHNHLVQKEGVWIHRKGAVSSKEGLVVLPGSRGSLTYIIKPTAETARSAWSLSHGAGRKWARSLCKSRIKNMYDRDSIRQTRLKSKVVCHDTDLLFQEAPEAYKNIEHIVAALLEHGLITLVASLKPLITYKG
ncbi:MAG: RNA ligase RtcB family protein [Peptococcaceae bacterium]|nr:RNA ligase RtcB family protein [Peptococcaceae bacterium]